MNKKKRLLTLTVLAVAVLASFPVFSVQNVYEYQNPGGVTEFTDQVKADQQAEKHIQIKKRTAEQEAQSKAKLAEIMKKDRELDERLAEQKKLENERLKRQQEARQKKLKEQQLKALEQPAIIGRRRKNSYYPPKPVLPVVPPVKPIKPAGPAAPRPPIRR